MESNHPSGGLLRPAGFEDRQGSERAPGTGGCDGRRCPGAPHALEPRRLDLLGRPFRGTYVGMADPTTKPRRSEGITIRHSRDCGVPDAERCRCRPAFQAQVFSPRDRRTIRKSFRSLSEARAWRSDTQTALRRGTVRAPTRTTLEAAADDWLVAAKAGIARTRSGDLYKPSALRSYEEALRTKALPELGNLRVSAVDRVAVQDFVDRLVARGLAPSTVRNSVLPLWPWRPSCPRGCACGSGRTRTRRPSRAR